MDPSKPINRTPARRPYADVTPAAVAAAEPLAFPEAALPADLKPVGEPAPAERPKPAVSFTIHALLDEFPIDVQFSGSAEQLAATVRRLRALGAVPPSLAARQAIAAERAREAPSCQDEACDRYGKAMRESAKSPGSYYCPGKTGTRAGQPVYCKSKA